MERNIFLIKKVVKEMPDKLKILAMEISELLLEKERDEISINWISILEAYDFNYLLEEYPRLTRSQYFGDEDYEYNVIDVLSQALHDNEEDAILMIQFLFDKYKINSNKLQELSDKYDFSTTEKKEINKTAFISYSNKNKQYCRVVKDALRQIGLDGFLVHEDINISREWADEIFNQLKQTDIFIALLSEDFKESEYCSQEVGMALQRDCMIIPLSIDGTEPYGFLNKIQSKPIRPLSQMQSEIVNYYPYAMINIILTNLNNISLEWNYNKCNKLLRFIEPHFKDFDEHQIYLLTHSVLINNQLHGNDGKEILRDFYEIHEDNIPSDVKEKFKNIIRKDY